MGLLIVDESRCKKDGICAAECPMAIIQVQKKESFPLLVQGGDTICLQCGHCVAVCPHGALSHDRIPLEKCPPIEKELVIEKAQAFQFLRSRRSIRFYKDQPVEREKIEELINLARYAPSAGNAQPVEWHVFTNEDQIQQLSKMTVEWMRLAIEKDTQGKLPPYMPLVVAGYDAGFDAILRSAPVVIAASASKMAANGIVDASLALSYLDLAAPTLGLGTCWAGLLQNGMLASKKIRDFMGLPEDHVHHYPMMLGYPKYKYHRLPERKNPEVYWK
jgi:nitroreductase/NAD-dependent dihydropyrimidine dehydrogenase PreA subunit